MASHSAKKGGNVTNLLKVYWLMFVVTQVDDVAAEKVCRAAPLARSACLTRPGMERQVQQYVAAGFWLHLMKENRLELLR